MQAACTLTGTTQRGTQTHTHMSFQLTVQTGIERNMKIHKQLNYCARNEIYFSHVHLWMFKMSLVILINYIYFLGHEPQFKATFQFPPRKNASYCLAHWLILSQLSYTAQAHLPNQDNLLGSLYEASLSWSVPLSRFPLLR